MEKTEQESKIRRFSEIMSLSCSFCEAIDYRKWIKEIPFIKFPEHWEVQIIPPFTGAVIRFRVKNGADFISVYLDCYDVLGWFGEPYWEVWPDTDGDVFRCKIKDTNALIEKINTLLEVKK